MPHVDGHIEPSVEFPWDELDRGNPLAAELSEATPKRESDSVTLGKIFGLLLTYGGTDPRQFFITANVLAFVLGLHPNQKASGEVIAAGLKMNKAAWFRRVNLMRKFLVERKAILPRIAGEWSKSARKSIKQKTASTHEKRKNTRQARQIINHLSAAYKKTGKTD